MSESIECVVVGAGVIGLATACQLAREGREVILLEAAETFGTGISSRNSEVIHAGLYYKPGSLKARLCVDGKARLYEFCRTHGVAHRRLGKLVVASDGVATHEMDEDGETVTDPHAWQSLSNGVLYVQNIARGLCAADAAGCATYAANADAYAAELTTLDATVREQLEAVPPEQRKVITTHDAFGYFAEAYGVTFLAPEGISTDAEPSAADVTKLITQIKSEGVRALFVENMSDPRLVQQIADETGVTLGGELYADALSLPDGPAPTYLDMFRHNVGLLIPAMGGR